MKKKQLTIRMTLLLIVGALNLIITLLISNGVYKSWENYQKAKSLQAGSEIISNLYTVNKNLSLTRALTLSLMYSGPEDEPSLQQDLLKNRNEIDKLLSLSLTAITEGRLNKFSKEIGQIKNTYQTLLQQRIEADAALKLSIEKRDPAIASRFFEINTQLITEIQNFILVYSRSYQDLNANINRHMMFEYFVWELADQSGQQYAIIGQMIAQDKHPNSQQREELISLGKHIEYDWEILQKFSLSDSLAKKLLPVMEEARTQYFFTFDQINELFYTNQSLATDASYPITAALWLGMSSQAVDSLLVLQDKTLQETQLQVDQIEMNAKREILFSVGIFLCALVLSIYCWGIIVFRVTRPVKVMIDTLLNATQQSVFDLRDIDDALDEIGKLALVLEAFQNNAHKMKESNQELERFAYIAAHDLKSPLRAVDNISQWLEEDLESLLPEANKKHLKELRTRVRLMDKLLDDTLEYARLNTNMKEVVSETVSGKVLMQEIVTLIAPPTGFSIKTGQYLTQLNLKKFPLQQVLYNLVNNAVKHHGKETGNIQVDAEEAGDNYVFSVRDDGQGIEPKYHQKIFEMFQTLQPREQSKGRGMGLAMVRKIVVTNGGTITVESDVGEGTVFRFVWPKVKLNITEVRDADTGERYA